MKIYHKNFKIYDFDTPENIIDRIALSHGILPQYLIFHGYLSFCEEKIPFNKKYPTVQMFRAAKEIEIENIVSSKNLDYMIDLIASSNNGNSYIKYRDELPDYVKNSENFDHNFIMFILHELRDDKFSWNIITIPMQNSDIGGRLEESSYKKWVSWLAKETLTLKNRVAATITEMELLENIPGLECTSVEITGKKHEVLFQSPFATNDQLFENLQTSNFFPLISMKEFYKVHKCARIPLQVLRGYQNMDTLNNILISYSTLKDSDSSYSAIFARIVDENILSLEITVNLGDEYHSMRTILNHFNELFQGPVYITETKNVVKSFNCEFFFPRLSLNKHVFGHLVLVDEFFSRSLFLNESTHSSKKKDSIYLYFMHENHTLTCTLTEENKRNINIRLRQNIKDKYVKVCIFNLMSMEDVSTFQTTLAKFLHMYLNKYKSIASIYEKFIPNFNKKKVSSRERSVEFFLKDYAPEIFVAGYPKKCGNQPIIIDDEKKEIYENAGRKVMVFPNETDSRKFSIPQYNYYCDHSEHQYPGLLVNDTFNNKNKFPYLPCCYINDQSIVPGSRYRNYFFSEDLLAGEKVAQNIIKTNKILDISQFGTLPELINRMLTVNDNKKFYFRQGSFPASEMFENNTFLHCVLSAMQTPNISHAQVDEFRQMLVKPRENISICRQEMYDKTTDEIINIINSRDEYLNPRMFIGLISFLFQCNIYIFGADGNIIIPNFSKFYINKYFENGATILIYENPGSESDNLKYPRCELIISTIDGINITTKFDKNENISKFLRKVYEDMIGIQYTKYQKRYGGIFEVNDLVSGIPTHQYIDEHGKACIYSIKYNDQKIIMGISPTKPLNLCEQLSLKEDIFIPNNKNFIGKFITQNRISILESSNQIIGLWGQNQVYFYVSSENNPKIDLSIITSDIDSYNFLSRFAAVLVEIFIWSFSVFMSREDASSLSDNVDYYINKFINKFVIIQPEKEKFFKLNPEISHTKFFSFSSPFFNENNQLIIFSNEILNKLVFNLKRKINSDLTEVQNYRFRQMLNIPFHIDPSGEKNQTQIIFGSHNLFKYFEGEAAYEKGYLNLFYSQGPYYFMFENSKYIAQPAKSLEDAYTIGKFWLEKGYNPGSQLPSVEEVILDYNLIEFRDNNEHIKQIFDSSFNIFIATKEFSSKVCYFSLLSIEGEKIFSGAKISL